jgi:hypothetical protein
MFGFGVGFGVGEFGSAGYAIEVDASAVTIVGGATLTAQPVVTLGDTSLVGMVAVSALSIDPGKITVTERPRQSSPQVRTAKPASTQVLRSAPVAIPTTSYTIKKRLPGEDIE